MRAALIALSVLMALAGVAAAYVLLRDDPPTCAGWSRQGTVPVGGPQTAASALAEHLDGPEGDDAPTKGLAAGDFVQVERTDGRVIFRTLEGDPVVEAEAVQMENGWLISGVSSCRSYVTVGRSTSSQPRQRSVRRTPARRAMASSTSSAVT